MFCVSLCVSVLLIRLFSPVWFWFKSGKSFDVITGWNPSYYWYQLHMSDKVGMVIWTLKEYKKTCVDLQTPASIRELDWAQVPHHLHLPGLRQRDLSYMAGDQETCGSTRTKTWNPSHPYLYYSINSQQQPPQAVLYFKLKTLIQRKHQQSKQRTNSIWTGNLQNQSQGGQSSVWTRREMDKRQTMAQRASV